MTRTTDPTTPALAAATGRARRGASGRTGRRWITAAIVAASAAMTAGLVGPSLAHAADADADADAGVQARRALPVYYVGTFLTGQNEPGQPVDRLYREFHRLRTPDRPAAWVRNAVLHMIDEPADDPDYTGIWPGKADVRSVKVQPAKERVVVDMRGIGGPGDPALEDEAALALQQLVYTATAAASIGGGTYTEVVVRSKSRTITHLWGADADQPLTRDPFARSAIWIDDPSHGDRVEGDVTVTGTAAFFEGEGQWTLLDADGDEVMAGSVTSEVGPETFRPYAIELGSLAKGRYTAVVYDPGGLGLPDRGPRDTKEFRVR